ncbi:MAG: peptidylprolyl isomerase [Pseudomonadota bacterium]|nr:peptidylprolyl isomerase [Pseudomonadota bacterium]
MTFPDWTREPLVHFLAAGAVLFAGLTLFGGDAVDPADRTISVGPAQQARIASQFEKTMGRPPTDAELDAGIESYVRDEVLYREALRLGLDQDDAVVRRRLVAKMDLAATAAVEAAEPDDATLQAFLDANADRYSAAILATFDQRYFTDEGAARAALASGNDPAGEAISLPASMEEASRSEIEVRFGRNFAIALERLEPDNQWQGPVPSGFGWHVVRLRSLNSAPADFEALRERLSNDWRSQQIADRKAQAFDILREAYRVEIDR